MYFYANRFIAVVLLLCLGSFSRTVSSASVGSIIISEVAWMGTAVSSNDEWIELYNTTDAPISLTNWTLDDDDGILVSLSGTISANGFFLLERTDDTTVGNITADIIYTGTLSNSGEPLTLKDEADNIIDEANGTGGSWPAGDSALRQTMSRTHPNSASGWSTHSGTGNGQDAEGAPLNGTPKQPNATWTTGVNLLINPITPSLVDAGASKQFQLSILNAGLTSADNVVVSQTLPTSFQFVSQDSAFAFSQPTATTLNWQLGTVAAQQTITLGVTLLIDDTLVGGSSATSTLSVTTSTAESDTSDNSADLTVTARAATNGNILIDAVHYDGQHVGEADEAIRLVNNDSVVIDVSNWSLQSASGGTAVIPANTFLSPNQAIWLTKEATTFIYQFGFAPTFEATDSESAVPNLQGGWPTLGNDGSVVRLYSASNQLTDCMVYESGDDSLCGTAWSGIGIDPYSVGSLFAINGQILYRKRDLVTGRPIDASNDASDWAQDRNDVHNGRKLMYPGWDLDAYFMPSVLTETADITIGIAPDNAFDMLASEIDAATTSIKLAALTFSNFGVMDKLLEALNRGVAVDVVLEGTPSGGIQNEAKYICQQLEQSGGNCWFMVSETGSDLSADSRVYDRYAYFHAKYLIIDNQRAIISSENMSPNSLPYDDKSDGTHGRRGVLIGTNATSIVDYLQTLWAKDFDPTNHADILAWTANHPLWGNDYGEPSTAFIAAQESGGDTYTIRYTTPKTISGTFDFEMVQAPENNLRPDTGLIGLLNQANTGDTILIQQLSERPFWGSSTSNPQDDPNPRLEAAINAARRGADVWLMLDEFNEAEYFSEDNPNSNLATCAYISRINTNESLNIHCARENKTGMGIHNKMFLAEIDGQGFVHVGSINGTENSNKANRELAIQFNSNDAYAYLATMFFADWTHSVYLPIIFNNYIPPADHVLISEVLYQPNNPAAEFIELYNPTNQAINIGGYAIGDTNNPDDFEDVREFPAGTLIPAQETIVVALSGNDLITDYNATPDFEIVNSNPAIPDMIDNSDYPSNALLRLGNAGDEVFLFGANGQIIDLVVYGNGSHGNVSPCPLVTTAGSSLERYPAWRNTDDCSADFREWFLPSPNSVPAS